MQNAFSISAAKFVFLVGLAFYLATSIPASAQQDSVPTATQDSINKKLLDRIDALESEVKQLKQQPPAPPPEPLPAVEVSRQNVVSDRLKLRIFGDVGYSATDNKAVTNTFSIGSLDLFMTARLSDKVSVLGEILFVSQLDNSITPDVERLLLQYRHNDYLTLSAGRYHASIGYYNTAFHQGAWFETAIGRPYMYAFDDQGGFLPLQEVGATASGKIPSRKLGLNYVAEIGNGRPHILDADPAQNRQDRNNGKSFNFLLSSRPEWVSGLEIGFSFYHDYLTFPDNDNHSETIPTAYVVYVNSTFEFLNEALLVTHTSAGRPDTHLVGFYSEASRKFGGYRPYFRYSYVNAAVSDSIYNDPTEGAIVTRRNGPSAGIRWDFTEHTALKLQYDRLSVRGRNSSNGVATQFAFTF